MALHPIEEATIRAFVASAKRDRLLTLLGSPKRRRQALDALNHFDDWNERFAQPMKSSVDILALLRRAGAPSECYVISDDDELDGRSMPLDEAVRACEEFDFASILCCIPGKLAFFYDEAMVRRNRVLLKRDIDFH